MLVACFEIFSDYHFSNLSSMGLIEGSQNFKFYTGEKEHSLD